MIIYKTGDIFDELINEPTIIINPVNCVGVDGKGLALTFKHKFPDNSEAYKAYCKLGLLKPGGIFLNYCNSFKGFIANAATKDHWRDPSMLYWIELICRQLNEMDDDNLVIVTGKMGCGNGGLDWENAVRSIYHQWFHEMKGTVIVYE